MHLGGAGSSAAQGTDRCLHGRKEHSMKGISFGIGIIAALVSIGAGVYLLTSQSAAAESTVFDVLMHGIGAYCVARGVWMLALVVNPKEQTA
jgi:hypothetical protein